MISLELNLMRKIFTTPSTDMAELRARNEVRLQKAKEALGERYVLHPVHSPVRVTPKKVLKAV